MNRWNLSLLVADYLAMRRHQLGREPGEEEVRAVHGFVSYVLNMEATQEGGRQHETVPGGDSGH